MPDWVQRGYQEYQRRLPRHLNLQLTEINPGPRGSGSTPEKAMAAEARALLKAASGAASTIALIETGKPWSTTVLSRQLEGWMAAGGDVALMVGGADGLAPEALRAAGARWSLGPLTLPHPLVRIVIAEQIYRAWTLLEGHPYHRA